MKILIYDTETTGLPDFKQPSEGPQQPHLVELAASLYDDNTGQQLEGFSVLIKPDGWVSGPEALAAHGITHDMGIAEGIPEHEALAMFLALHAKADMRAAHNEAFDQRILRIAIKRFGNGQAGWEAQTQEAKDATADAFKSRPAYCTCNATKPLCKLPPTARMNKTGYGSGFKAPKLEEAYMHFFGLKLEGAHRAHVDVAACARLYFHINPIVAAA
jgi:DNA polymerase-3 subunit epsilon